MDDVPIRLQKLLAQAGIGSRRYCDELVAAGRVTVNGQIAGPGTKVDPQSDSVAVDGRPVVKQNQTRVLILNKPRGVVTTMSDDRGRPCVGDLVKDIPERLFHVGRLDEDTSGLLLLTNDGDLAHRLTHPSHGVSKTYLARVQGRMPETAVRQLQEGIELPDGPAVADRVTVRSRDHRSSLVEIVVHIGRKRIVRRMLKAVGHPVEELTRTAIGGLTLGGLRLGELRDLDPTEVTQLTRELN